MNSVLSDDQGGILKQVGGENISGLPRRSLAAFQNVGLIAD